jgi:hypothetical protein
LAGYWAFNEGEGDTAYDSVGNNDGTLINNPIRTTGKVGGALEFDGVDEYVTLPSNAVTITEFTVSGWANHYGPGGGEKSVNCIFSQRDDTIGSNHPFILLITEFNDGYAYAKIRSTVGSDQLLKYPKKNYYEWHHYVMTVSATDFIFYIDGIEVDRASNNQDGDYTTSIDHVYIGKNEYDGYQGRVRSYFNGLIDEVALWDGALSAQEVEELYLDGLGDLRIVPIDDFEPAGQVGGPFTPASMDYQLKNIGPNSISWEVEKTADWLDVSTVSGELDPNESVIVTVSLNTLAEALRGGIYIDTVTFTDITNERELNREVALTVIGPIIELSASEFAFYAFEDAPNPDDQILTIHNGGGGTLDWEITYSNCDWLQIDPNKGSSTGEPDDVTLSVDISGLSDGEYNCQLTVFDPCAMNNPQYANVTLNIHDPNGLLVPLHYPTIQAAINAAFNGETVIVADGTYTGDGNRDIDLLGKAITVKSANGPQNCIINCQNSGRGFYFHNGEDPNSVLDGLTITNGNVYYGYGGGIYIDSSSPTIQNCIISGNRVLWTSYGGGICLRNSLSLIDNCIISYNLAEGDYMEDEWSSGGGIGLINSDVTIRNCVIAGNLVIDGSGGGVCGYRSGYYSSPAITNCMIIGNTCYSGGLAFGGGLDACNGPIDNCTIANNWVNDWDLEGFGGGLDSCYGTITNCIIWDNVAGEAGEQIFESSTPTYSCIKDWTGGGTGNISANPYFANPNNADYHLKSQSGRWDPNTESWIIDPNTSPCIDMGDPNSDYSVEPWPHGHRVNMGAYGNTPEASRGGTNIDDVRLMGADWLQADSVTDMIPYPNGDGIVDLRDYAFLALHWLWAEQ